MVMMGDPFVGNVSKKLSNEELIQALRVDIAGELEAIMAYDAHAMAAQDDRVRTILYSIRDEERQHVGELVHLMELLDPREAQLLAKGKQEVDQLLGQKAMGQQSQPGVQQAQQQSQQGTQNQQAMQSGNIGQQIQSEQYRNFQQPYTGNLGPHPGNLGHHGQRNWQ